MSMLGPLHRILDVIKMNDNVDDKYADMKRARR